MSIILRALKKIQNQGGEQAPAEARGAEESTPAVSSAAAADESGAAEGAGLPHEAVFGDASQAMPPVSAQLETTKPSRIPRYLIGLIAVLIIIATAWFAHIINFKSGRERDGMQAHAAKSAAADGGTPIEVRIRAPEPATEPSAEPIMKPPAAEAPIVLSLNPPAEQPVKPAAPEARHVAAGQAPEPAELPPAAPPDAGMPIMEPSINLVTAFPAATAIPSEPKEAHLPAGKTQPASVARPELKINAIAWRAQEPKAIVNMQRVYAGDVIEGALVKEIRRKSILFEFKGEEFELRF
jgi:hypothetical protein